MHITSEQILLSSPLGYQDQASIELYKNDFFVHTLESDHPFLIFDIGQILIANAIVISNRNINPEIKARATGLKLAISQNFTDWKEINLYPSEDLSYFIALSNHQFRFIKLSLEGGKNRIINLKGIELFDVQIPAKTKQPQFQVHRLISGTIINGIYYHTYDWGFFSNLTTTLQDIANHYESIDVISNQYSFSRYKDAQGLNTWNAYFAKPNKNSPPELLANNIFGKDTYQHAPYNQIDFTVSKSLINDFFVPNKKFLSRFSAIQKKYRIDFEKTIFIYYRGTDKKTELEPASVNQYLERLQPLLENDPSLNVFLQTDDREFCESFQKQYSGALTILDELPIIDGDDGFHNLVNENKFQSSLDFFAIVLLMSQCQYLLLNTSNVSFWACLYRGHAEGVFQIDMAVAND